MLWKGKFGLRGSALPNRLKPLLSLQTRGDEMMQCASAVPARHCQSGGDGLLTKHKVKGLKRVKSTRKAAGMGKKLSARQWNPNADQKPETSTAALACPGVKHLPWTKQEIDLGWQGLHCTRVKKYL